MNQNAPRSPKDAANQKDGPKQVLLSVVGRHLAKILAIASFVVSLGLLVAAIWIPTHFANPFARFAYCAALGVYSGVFFFILYPARYDVTVNIAGLPTGLALVGPIALTVGLFLLLDQYAPHAPSGKFFEIKHANGRPLEWALVEIRHRSQSVKSLLVPRDKTSGILAGAYVYFDGWKREHAAEIEYDAGDGKKVQRIVFDLASEEPIVIGGASE